MSVHDPTGTPSTEQELRVSPILAALPQAALEQFAPLFVIRSYEAGQSLYNAGEPARTFFFILEGKAKIARASEDGKEVIISFYGKGDFLGCCSLLATTNLPCTAIAIEPTRAACLSRADLYRVLAAEPGFAAGMLQAVTARLRSSHKRTQNLALDTAGRRVVSALLELDDRFGRLQSDGTRVIRIKVTRLELAEMAGTTLETASRTMARLKQQGLVASSRRGIVLLSRPELESAAVNLL